MAAVQLNLTLGGKRNTQKLCKKQVNFSKTGGKFLKVGGKCTETGKIGGWSMTKKMSSEILSDENRIEKFFGKR